MRLDEVVGTLERHYGKPPRSSPVDPFVQILAENASYLVDEELRARVLARLAEKIGITPEAILKAKPAAIVDAIAEGGMRPPMRAKKLIDAALIAKELGAPLAQLVKQPLAEAKRVLRKFPGIAEPGAEKIALFAGAHPVLGLESNGLRVLIRLGFAQEDKSYARSWLAVRSAIAKDLPSDIPSLQRMHLLLRRHGQELCKRTKPLCAECPLRAGCPSA